jgi:hypothetical protein
VLACNLDFSGRATPREVSSSRGRGFDLHASPKAHRFGRIQVLHKDFSEELPLLYQALAKDTVQSKLKTLVKYGIPEIKFLTFAASSFANTEFLSSPA